MGICGWLAGREGATSVSAPAPLATTSEGACVGRARVRWRTQRASTRTHIRPSPSCLPSPSGPRLNLPPFSRTAARSPDSHTCSSASISRAHAEPHALLPPCLLSAHAQGTTAYQAIALSFASVRPRHHHLDSRSVPPTFPARGSLVCCRWSIWWRRGDRAGVVTQCGHLLVLCAHSVRVTPCPGEFLAETTYSAGSGIAQAGAKWASCQCAAANYHTLPIDDIHVHCHAPGAQRIQLEAAVRVPTSAFVRDIEPHHCTCAHAP
ncbi:hypothetical protein DENSPDRAFT_454135 [Dentipellis sp. KUC8613]|nr:hypothetical protein DENSPDRAFT_454135 [Dentipellis sp. KUC8613]